MMNDKDGRLTATRKPPFVTLTSSGTKPVRTGFRNLTVCGYHGLVCFAQHQAVRLCGAPCGNGRPLSLQSAIDAGLFILNVALMFNVNRGALSS